MPHVTMFVQNGVHMDNRVLKEARVLRDAGYTVNIVGKQTDPSFKAEEDFEGIRIFRVGGDQRLRMQVHERYEQFRKLLLDLYMGIQPPPFQIAGATGAAPRLIDLAREGKLLTRTGVTKLRDVTISQLYNRLLRRTVSLTTKLAFYTPATKAWAAAYREIMKSLNRIEPITYLVDWHLAVAELGDRIKADVWHAHDIDTLPTAHRLRETYGGKLIYDAHEYWLDCNNVYTPFEAWSWEQLERHYIKKADAVITVSDSIADVLARKYGVAKPRLVLNTPDYRAVAADRGQRDRLGIPADAFVIIYVGLITHKRGYEQLIDALPLVPDGYLLFLGPGAPDYVSALKTQAEKNGVSSRVIFAGAVKPDAIQAFTAMADIGVVVGQRGALSYECALPSKYFEYVFAGLPVATSAFIEMERLTREFQLGETFDERDPASIAKALDTVRRAHESYRGPAWHERRMRLISRYAWGSHKQELLSLYDDLTPSSEAYA